MVKFWLFTQKIKLRQELEVGNKTAIDSIFNELDRLENIIRSYENNTEMLANYHKNLNSKPLNP